MKILPAWLVHQVSSPEPTDNSAYACTELAQDRVARRADEAHSNDIVRIVGDREVESYEALFV